MFNILVLCTANICRSPAAKVILSDALHNRAVQISSAGTRAIGGNLVDPLMQTYMIERGFPSLSEHRSSALMPSQLTSHQLILCMERTHLECAHRLGSVAVGKTMLLGHWSGGVEVDDPIGGTPAMYANAIDKMQHFCNQWINRILAMGLAE